MCSRFAADGRREPVQSFREGHDQKAEDATMEQKVCSPTEYKLIIQ